MKFIHIPVETAITPFDGARVMMNRYWAVHKDGHISAYTGNHERDPFGRYPTYSPQCNRHESIASIRGKYKTIFLQIVYWKDLRR